MNKNKTKSKEPNDDHCDCEEQYEQHLPLLQTVEATDTKLHHSASDHWDHETNSTNTTCRRKMNAEPQENLKGQPSEIVLKKNRRKRTPAPLFYKQITNVSHVCATSISAYIVYLCFKDEFVFFTWHPFLFAIGWMSIMTEGILILTKHNFLADRISHTWRIRLHWILQSVAISCTIIAFTIVVVNKNLKNKQHWKSWHGLLGLISVIFAVIPTIITGLPALYHKELRGYISSKLNQLIHSIFGICTLLFGSITMMCSLYTKWFERRTGGNLTVFSICWVVMFVPLVWVLFHTGKRAIGRGRKWLGKGKINV